MTKKKRYIYLAIGIILVMIVLYNYPSLLSTELSISSESTDFRTYKTARTCSNFMGNIGNKNMQIPFTWVYSTNSKRQIQSFEATKTDGCKIKYNILPSPKIYETSKICVKFIADEYKKGNFNGFCWSKTKSILNIYDKQNGCVVEYIQGCEDMKIKQDIPELLLGDGDNKKINIVIFSYNFNNSVLPYFLYLSNNVVNIVKTTNPFSDNLNKFNIYRVINGSNIGNEDGEENYDTYLAKTCEGILNKPEDIIFLVDTSIWGFGTTGYGGRRPNCWRSHVYGDFCPAIAQASGNNKLIIIHEIGHTFNLNHDFLTDNFMSYNLNSNHFEDYQKETIIRELNKFIGI